jgi:hypothetical protein
MMLLLWVVLLAVFLWIFFPMGPVARFKKYKEKVHKYSGLDPKSWERFLTNIHEFERLASTDQLDESAAALYAAVENIRDIAMGIRRADDAEHQEDLNTIANELGYEGEFIINQNAISRGIHFFPKYLNESLMDYPDARPDGPFPRLRSDS